MTAFRYMAIGSNGEIQRGLMEAASEAEVVERLRRQGATPMRADPARQGVFRAQWNRAGFIGGLRSQEVADLIRELAIMLGAGQDLDRALRYLQETAPNRRVNAVVTSLRDSVRDGSPLSAAVARDVSSFSRLHVGLISAGEAGGNLAPTLARMADLLDRQRSLAATITSALIYPALLLVAAIGSVSFLLVEVLPQFVPLFEENNATLPGSTRLLIDLGHFVANAGPSILLGMLALFLVGRALRHRPALRLAVDRALLRLPLLGGLLREILAARFTRVLGTLLMNGVPLISALDVVRAALGNTAAVAAVERASASARGGGGLAQALAKMQIFPPRTIHLLRLGEENAQLATMAIRAADIHEERVRLAMQRLLVLLVPAITIAMGIVVAFIVASLMTAMLSLNDLATP
jgi:general secretion pathway protein F